MYSRSGTWSTKPRQRISRKDAGDLRRPSEVRGRGEQRQSRHEVPKPVVHRVPVRDRIDWVQDRRRRLGRRRCCCIVDPGPARFTGERHWRRLPARRFVGVKAVTDFETSPDAQIPSRRSARTPGDTRRAAAHRRHALFTELACNQRRHSCHLGAARGDGEARRQDSDGQSTARGPDLREVSDVWSS